MKCALLLEVFDLQLLERRGHRRFSSFRKFVRRELIFRAGVPERHDEFAWSKRFLRAEKERFNDLREVHMSHTTYTSCRSYSPSAL